MKHKGIIFDMDGTLWDSAENVAASWNLAISELGLKREPITKEDMYHVMGKTMDVIADILFPDFENKYEVLDYCGKRENEYLEEHGGMIYPGVKETLEKLQKEYGLYIVSNCQIGYIEAFLHYYGLEQYFKDTLCYGENKLQKGDNIALMATRNKLDAAVYVGDIQADYEASCHAGTAFIHAAYGFGKINDIVPEMERFSDLPDILDKVDGFR